MSTLRCDICGCTFTKISVLRKHYRNECVYHNSSIQSRFKRGHSLTIQPDSMLSGCYVRCHLCKDRFSTIPELDMHIRDTHTPKTH